MFSTVEIEVRFFKWSRVALIVESGVGRITELCMQISAGRYAQCARHDFTAAPLPYLRVAFISFRYKLLINIPIMPEI